MAFKAYDLDNSGTLENSEVRTLITDAFFYMKQNKKIEEK